MSFQTQNEVIKEINLLKGRINKLEKFASQLPKSSAPSSNGGLGYLVYTALLTQTGTNAPVATILENTLGGVPAWSYDGTGFYFATLTGVFTVGKTVVFLGTISPNSDSFIVNDANNVNQVYINSSTISAGVLVEADNILSNTPIEIRVYP